MTVCSFSTFGLFKAKNNHLLFISTPSSHSHTHHPTMILTDKDLQLLSSMQAASQSAGIDSASDHIGLISDRVGSGKDLNDLKIGECDSCSTSKSRVDSTRLIFSFFNSSTSSTLLRLPSSLCNSKYSSHSFYSFHFSPTEFDGTTVLCRVCGDKASGFHYGVHSCEGCKVCIMLLFIWV